MQSDFSSLWMLFNCISAYTYRGETNILRLERKNILRNYGDTDTYKSALIMLGKCFAQGSYELSNNSDLLEKQKTMLTQLQQSLLAIKPKYKNEEWAVAYDGVTKLLEHNYLDNFVSHTYN